MDYKTSQVEPRVKLSVRVPENGSDTRSKASKRNNSYGESSGSNQLMPSLKRHCQEKWSLAPQKARVRKTRWGAPLQKQVNQAVLPIQTPPPNQLPSPTSNISTVDVNEFLITFYNELKAYSSVKEEKRERPTPVLLNSPEFLKELQPSAVNLLYSGLHQCGVCGTRFSEDQRQKYIDHVDWHIQRKRGEYACNQQGWYCTELSDWTDCPKIENTDESKMSFFQKQKVDSANKKLNQQTSLPTCAAPRGHDTKKCNVCLDPFEEFYDDDEDEWRLRNAICVEDQFYHPVCYEDQKNQNDVIIIT
jgi:hypothetical protein